MFTQVNAARVVTKTEKDREEEANRQFGIDNIFDHDDICNLRVKL